MLINHDYIYRISAEHSTHRHSKEWQEGSTRSVLDYIAVNQEDECAITELVIDEGRQYTPVRAEKNKDHITSDHNTLLAKFNWLIDEEERREEPRRVITTKGYGRIKAEMKEKKIWL